MPSTDLSAKVWGMAKRNRTLTKLVGALVDQDTKDRFQALANREGLSESELLRQILADRLAKEGA